MRVSNRIIPPLSDQGVSPGQLRFLARTLGLGSRWAEVLMQGLGVRVGVGVARQAAAKKRQHATAELRHAETASRFLDARVLT